MMNRAKKIAIAVVTATLLLIIVVPMIAIPADAAAVLESPIVANANIGQSFLIGARGFAQTSSEIDAVVAVTIMHLEFEIVRKGLRGVMFNITSGTFVINETSYVITGGVGIARRITEGPFNGSIGFGFRFNMTGPTGDLAEIGFRGVVLRTEDNGIVLVMRGGIQINSLSFQLAQRGRISRL